MEKAREKIIFILIAAMVARVAFSFFGTLQLDFNTYLAWSSRLNELGFSRFYEAWSDYLPGYLYVLWFLAKVKSAFPIPDTLLYKFPSILADCLTGLLIYSIVKKIKSEKWAIALSAIYLFNPAILANSTLWGQIDSLTAFFILFSIWVFPKNIFLSSILISTGTLIKPQAAFIAPVLLFLVLKNKVKPLKVAVALILGVSLFLVAFVPFSGGKEFLPFVVNRLSLSLNQYQYTSVNAFNFWGIVGFWLKDTVGLVSSQAVGFFLTALSSLVVFLRFRKEKNKEYLLAAGLIAGTFTFLTRMHERHLLPVLAPLAVASSFNPSLLIVYVGYSLTYIANLAYSYIWISEDFRSIFSGPILKLISFVNVLLFFLLLVKPRINWSIIGKLRWPEVVRKDLLKEVEKLESPIKVKIFSVKLILALILLFSLISRLVGLGKPQNEYFDEVYHAFTAREILHGNPKAWEWWNTPPEGFAYEWTHPPLAKLGMVVGMLIFGENAFGWRIPGALLGVGTVFLIFLIAREIFKDEVIALLASFIFSLDGLVLQMSRIGMNDIYFLFFALLAIYLFLKDRYFFSALALGLAGSSKWSTIWAIPIIIAAHFLLNKKFTRSYLWFLIVPPIVYIASYIPMFLTHHGLNTFIEVQQQMWWYHTRLSATHPFTSPWWSWPILGRPIWLYTSGVISGKIANIYAFGNPFVFWFGLFSTGVALLYAFLKKEKRLLFVVFSYLIFFVPWAMSPRIMFLYHYLPSIPFLAIASAFILKRFSFLVVPLLVITFITFLYFFPHVTGITVPESLDNTYYWFSSWR